VTRSARPSGALVGRLVGLFACTERTGKDAVAVPRRAGYLERQTETTDARRRSYRLSERAGRRNPIAAKLGVRFAQIVGCGYQQLSAAPRRPRSMVKAQRPRVRVVVPALCDTQGLRRLRAPAPCPDPAC
jgi:hypothetical protein